VNLWQVLRQPVVTEKSTFLAESGKYVFKVDRRANKHDVKRAVEQAFNVSVVGVNTMTVHDKTKRYGIRPHLQPSWKKAIVTLRTGDSIQLFEGS